MELHHHSHTPRRKWTHYFWEFIMLFLAVFCGFLAEYQLEHKIEKDRERQYMQSFIYDLQNDIVNLRDGFPRKDGRINAIDSIFLFFETNTDVKTVPGYVLRYMRRSTWDRHYRRNSTTMDQLKNAGGLRLIRKDIVRDSIAAYDLQWQRAEFWKERYMDFQNKGLDLVQKIINAKDFLPQYKVLQRSRSELRANDSLYLKINTEYLNHLLNFLADQKISTHQDKEGYQAIEKSAQRLIDLIKKEYNLSERTHLEK